MIVAELTAAIKKWKKFGPYAVPNCPILLIDLENKERITKVRLERAVEGDLACLQQWTWVYLPEKALPLNPTKIEQMIRHFQSMTDQQKPLVVIDTMRSAFQESELEGTEMRELLYPLQRVAQRTGAAILILHHRPKNGAKYAGMTEIAAALDYLWVWSVDRETKIGTLELYGTRGDPANDLIFHYDERSRRNLYLAEAEHSQEEIDNMFRKILSDGNCLTQSQLTTRLQSVWGGPKVPGVKKIHALVDGMVGSLLVKSSKGGAYYYSLFQAL